MAARQRALSSAAGPVRSFSGVAAHRDENDTSFAPRATRAGSAHEGTPAPLSSSRRRGQTTVETPGMGSPMLGVIPEAVHSSTADDTHHHHHHHHHNHHHQKSPHHSPAAQRRRSGKAASPYALAGRSPSHLHVTPEFEALLRAARNGAGRVTKLRIAKSGVPLEEQGALREIDVPAKLMLDYGSLLAFLSHELDWADTHGGLQISRLFSPHGRELVGVDPRADLRDGDIVVPSSGAEFVPIMPVVKRQHAADGSPRSRGGIGTGIGTGNGSGGAGLRARVGTGLAARSTGTIYVFANGTPLAKQTPVKVVLRPSVNMPTLLSTITCALGWNDEFVGPRAAKKLYTAEGEPIAKVSAISPGAEIIATGGEPLKII